MVARKSAGDNMPAHISPMLCTLTEQPTTNEAYLYEIKWDGYRIISFYGKDTFHMDSRSGKDYTLKYPVIAEAIKELGHDLVIDGEVVVFNDQGKPDFDALQKYNGHRSSIHYCVFDLLWLDGRNLMPLPLQKRKELLKMLIKDNPVFKFSESFDDGIGLYEQMMEKDMEGIVAKRKDGAYHPGERGPDWLKVPTRKRQEFVIGGYAESERGRSFRSLLFGAYNQGKLEWIGRSGGGFKDKEMPAILKKLQALEIQKSPFVNKVLDTKGAVIHYVKPQLVANFSFATWTKSGRIRKPATFLGFRNDKRPKDVVREVPREVSNTTPSGPPSGVEPSSGSPSAKKENEPQQRTSGRKHPYLNKDSGWVKVDKEAQNAQFRTLKMGKCAVNVHNLEHELWTGVPKAKLIMYYNKIADYLLPHLKGRPQSLNLVLSNIHAPRVFIKDMENRQPPCSEVFPTPRKHPENGKRDTIDYLVCNNLETLLYMVDLGCVDINPWASRVQAPEVPDYIWLDLDPTISKEAKSIESLEDAGFKKAVEVALAAKQILDIYGLQSFVKTSGKTGVHIYIPCLKLPFTTTRTIAEHLAKEIHQLVPKISTLETSIVKRGTKCYIDAGQNDYADTLAAPYTVRPYHHPIISTPLNWKEVKLTLDRWAFTMEGIQKRVSKQGDLFSGVLSPAIAKQNLKVLNQRFL
jgi:bifunctional non-homologous end joining protein LigD